MRFDDTLETVLAGDFSTPSGMQSAWRQLVDLIGRRRVYADPRALNLLRGIRPKVPVAVRAASARGLEYADPPAALVRLLAVDEVAVAMPVLRSARLTSNDWIGILPELAPVGRAVLRNRRDLSPVVRRALESYGPIDFVLPDESAPVAEEVAVEPEIALAEEAAVIEASEPVAIEEPELAVAVEQLVDWTDVIGAQEAEPEPEPEPVAAEPLAAPEEIAAPETAESEPFMLAPEITESPLVTAGLQAVEAAEPEPETLHIEEDFSFVALAEQAASLPSPTILAAVAPPAIQSGTVEANPDPEPIARAIEAAHQPPMAPLDTAVAQTSAETSEIAEGLGADLPAEGPIADPLGPQHEPEVAARENEADGPFQISEVVARIDAFWKNREEAAEAAEAAPRHAPAPAEHFRFETDAKGVIRWVDGVSRAPIVGLSLDLQGTGASEGSGVDGVATGAFRRRAGFSNARMAIDGESDASGDWLISAIPVFDPANGRFTGYRGTARRPRADERAEPVRPAPAAGTAADSLRQLVHELRTPTNAIAGFAEMIETQMLGPVSDPYRDRATTIRAQARELLGAIDDLDLAARIDSAALALVPGRVTLRPLLSGIADDLAQLAALRGSALSLPIDDLAVTGDRRAVERLLARLMATLVSASGPGERIGIRTALEADDKVTITMDRPAALSDYPGDSVLGIDDEGGDSTLLGTGFALRLARNLARELGGSLVIEPESLTLRLPASVTAPVGQAHLS
ncbi:sensor histidine kinase [Sphingomonas sp. LB-2]|uniref:sensor histidine kinase n=1 Tax=Sphingomonas caeni TaxID=2984949 RepID=UPI0022323F66|nr:histidine kinase dimerization/phospho-acceptor domain-containing protein [Sphingomonas caeni]MCW3849204.1 sensor histidine kinase [Sphingomonas caeni]